MLRVLSHMERSNTLLCKITKKRYEIYSQKKYVLKMLKEVSEDFESVENAFFDAYT